MAEKLSGTPISGGDYVGYPASNAFDGNTSTWWISSQATTAGNGTAYIGLILPKASRIKQIQLATYCVQNTPRQMSLRYSDGGSWRVIHTVYSFAHSSSWQTIDIPIHEDKGLRVALWCDLCSSSAVDGANSFVLRELSFLGLPVVFSRPPLPTPIILSTMPATLSSGFSSGVLG